MESSSDYTILSIFKKNFSKTTVVTRDLSKLSIGRFIPMSNLTLITFNKQHLSPFNIGWKTLSRPTSPTKKVFEFSPSSFDGSYDFSKYNPDNRPHYESSEISSEIQIVNEPTLQASQLKLQQIMQFLHSANGRKKTSS